MKITCGSRAINHHCLVETFKKDKDGMHKVCTCHIDSMIQFGELADGCCRECSCPKTFDAFERLYPKEKVSLEWKDPRDK